MTSIGIGKLAARAGVSIDTVRYYERRELLGLSRQRDVARVKRAAEKKLAEVDARLAALQRMREGLATLVATCPGHGRAADCPILKALGEEPLQ